MKIKINTAKMNGMATEGMEQAILERFKKVEPYLKDDEPVKVTVEPLKNQMKVSVQVVLHDNHHMKVECVDQDFYSALFELRDELKRNIRKRKERYLGRRHNKEIAIENEAMEATAVEDYPKIGKVKYFRLGSETEIMALNEMERMGHDHYIFKNANLEDKICMIYKRMDGDYGMIVTE